MAVVVVLLPAGSAPEGWQGSAKTRRLQLRVSLFLRWSASSSLPLLSSNGKETSGERKGSATVGAVDGAGGAGSGGGKWI